MTSVPRGAEVWQRRIDRTTRALAVLGGFCLFAILTIVTAGVIMRYAFSAPLLGVNEIVQLTAVALVMLALPYCTARGDHVAVDVFEAAIGRWGRFLGDLVSRGLSAFVLVVLCRRAMAKSADALEWGDATNMLQMPIWPFYAILAAGTGLCALILMLQLAFLVLRGAEE